MRPYERKYPVRPMVTSLHCECGTEMEMVKLVNASGIDTWHYRCPSCKEECRVAKQYPILEYIEVKPEDGCGPNCKCNPPPKLNKR